MSQPLKLLISNDDGVNALGIRTLANTLAEAGHQVTVVCPDRERSATGHGLTLHQPIRATLVEGLFHPQVTVWSCSGTPADCVKLALFGLLEAPPDYVLAGINHGPNLGTDILCSGTVSAAMEGILEGIPSLAFSLANYVAQDFQPAAAFARKLLTTLIQRPLQPPMLLNVNIPAVPTEKIVGVMITRLGIRRYFDIFQKRTDPRGKTYYWLAGEVMEDITDESTLDLAHPTINPDNLAIIEKTPTDVQAIRENHITVTPIHANLTFYTGLLHLQDWSDQLTP